MAITLNRDMSGIRPGIVAQTYGLLSMGLILASVCAVASLGATFSFWGMIGAFVGCIALMFGAMMMKDSIIGLLCYFGFISLMGYMTGPTINQYLEMQNGATIVMQALGTTAIATIGLSLYP
jgi:modulator of FtsH protease